MTTAPEGTLASQVGVLSTAVTSLKQSVLVLSARLRRTRLIALGTGIGLVLDLILSVGMFYVATSVISANHSLNTQLHETCALYSLFIRSYNPASAAKSPLGAAGYVDAFRQLEVSADHLNCGIPHKV